MVSLRPFVFLLCLIAVPAAAAEKLALVIGNAAYPEAPLRNPVNDARAVAAALKSTGFTVIQRENMDYRAFRRTLAEFADQAANSRTTLFYYAGHGIQHQGGNFLVPVDAAIRSENTVRAETVDLDLVLDAMGETSSRTNIVILDACRVNPFGRRFRGAAQQGLAMVNAAKGTLVAYATAPGMAAADGDGANGTYTGELLKAMALPGLKVEDMFKVVRARVATLTQDQQVPWESSSLTGDFYFRPPKAGQAAALPGLAPTAPREREEPGDRAGSFESAMAAYNRQDYRSAAAQARPAAERGDARAQDLLGWLYQNGHGLPQDLARALDWYQKAADLGLAKGQQNVSFMYRNGMGVPVDYAKSLFWAQKAAAQGNANGQISVGLHYLNGWGVARDYARAMDMFMKAAAQNDSNGQHSVAYMYENGLGVESSRSRARDWYARAATQGNPDSVRALQRYQ
jgi:uncharacterized caspase-like protein